MKFKFLLYLLAKMMIRAAVKNEMFKKTAAGRDAAFEIKTRDGRVVRHFVLDRGEVRSRPGKHPNPDFAVVFEDARYGFSVLTSKDKHAFLDGILAKKITLEGDFTLVIWFQNLMELMKKPKTEIPPDLETIGFVGAGLIGAPMIRSLIRNRYRVKAYDIDPRALESVVAYGAVAVDNLDGLTDTNVVIVMVNNMEQARQVVWEICGKRNEKTPFTIVVMSTVSPDDMVALRAELDEKGFSHIQLLDAPVSGAPLNAEAGKLAIMAGGDRTVFENVKPVFEALGETIYHTGKLGSGSAMKLVNNILGLTGGLITVEALYLGIKKGLVPEQMIEVINNSSGQNFLTRQWPLTVKLFEIITTGEVYGAKDAIFKTGGKDLEVTKAWADSDGIKLQCLEDGINYLEYLSHGAFDDMLKLILEKSTA